MDYLVEGEIDYERLARNLIINIGVDLALGSISGEAWGKQGGTVETGSGADDVLIVSKYEDIYSYQYNSMTNPGPLAEIRGVPAGNFYGGRYNVVVLDSDIVFYRAGEYGKPLGQWFTAQPLDSIAQVRIDLAVKPQWINPSTGVLEGTSRINCIYAIKIPRGTTIYMGPVGYQGGAYLGGLNTEQIFISQPWNISGVEVTSVLPIKK